MKFHSHTSRPGRPSAFTPFSILASALLGFSLLASASAQDSLYVLVTPSVNDGALLGNSDSSEAAFSADGRFIAFTSKASNLVALPTNGPQDVFVRDMQTGTTRLVSVNKDGTGGGNGASSEPRVSADGRYVAFSSLATDLVAADANGVGSDVFVRDIQTGATTLVTANTGGTITKLNVSAHPSMTPDGRYVAFFGSPPDLGGNVFVRDMQTGATTLVSVNSSGGAAGGFEPVISANGRVVVFGALRDNLDQPPAITTQANLFARDLVAGATALVSVNEAGTGGGDNQSRFPSLSADGRFVAFHSSATNLSAHQPWGIYVRDLTAGVTTPAGVPDVPHPRGFISMAPAISADGRYVAYAYNYFDSAGKGGVARYDRATGALSTLPDPGLCAGRAPACGAISFSPSLSADGRFVAFGETAADAGGFIEAAYFGDFLSLTMTNVTTQPVEDRPSELATRAVISAAGRSSVFPTRNSLTQSSEHVNVLNLYTFTPSDTDTAGVNGLIQFGTPSFRVEEGAGSISIPVIRGTFAGASGTSAVAYTTADRTATAGQDYVSTSGTLTFGPGEDVKFINVPLVNDSVYEGVETFTVNLSNPTGGYALGGTNPAAAVVIHDSIKPTVTIGDTSSKEAEDAVFTVTLSESPVQPISIEFTTMNGTANLRFGGTGGDYIATGGTLVFNPGEKTKTVRASTLPDLLDETDETFFVLLLLPEDVVSAKSTGTATIHNDTTPVVQLNFTGGSFVASEPDGGAVVSVSRVGGDPSSPFSVDYSTSDGTASERSDYTAAFGTLRFAAGETSKTFTIFITDDSLVEPAESFSVTLGNPQGATLGPPSTASVTINSDDSMTPAASPADDSTFFVRQHYRDFLNREADAPGLAFWVNEIEKCGADQQCRDVRRINVSAAFFLSIEFQNEGYFVYLLRHAAFNTGETLGVRTFLTDTQEVGRGVVVNQGEWKQQLEANKQALLTRLASSPEFAAAYPASLTAAEYVDALNSHTLDPLNPSSGGALTQSEREALASDLSAGRKTRAEVLRAVAENGEFRHRQFDKGFVFMQYVGYLRRNPGDLPDTNFNGYNFWLAKLDSFEGDFIKAEMVKAFISSDEYRHRFGQ